MQYVKNAMKKSGKRNKKMIKPTKPIEEYEKYGFRKCKGSYGKNGCYYLCVSRGCEIIFISPLLINIISWTDNDSRIHKNPNCRYRDKRTAIEIICEMAMDGLLKIE